MVEARIAIDGRLEACDAFTIPIIKRLAKAVFGFLLKAQQQMKGLPFQLQT